MTALSGPFLAAAALLALAGAAKLRRPEGTRQALRTQGLPDAAALVRLLGAGELAIAAAALAGLRAGAGAVALAYAAFTAFVLLALVRGRPLSSCGCFAEPDLPPTWAHPVVTAALAAAAAAVVGTPAGIPQLVAAGPAGAVGALVGAVLVAGLALLVLAELPRLRAAVAQSPADPAPAGPRTFALTPVARTTPSALGSRS